MYNRSDSLKESSAGFGGREPSESSLECVAIVWTELQQVMLCALVKQANWSVRLIFVRDGIRVLATTQNLGAQIVRVPNLSYSANDIPRYRDAARRIIDPLLATQQKSYRCLTWTTEHPLSKAIVRQPACGAISFFEDGTGSYVDWGTAGWRHGIKYVVTKAWINLASALEVGARVMHRPKDVEFWSLFPDPAPGKRIPRRALASSSFRLALEETLMSESHPPKLVEGSVVYLPSPYADCNLMNDEEEIAVHADALLRVFREYEKHQPPIFWKSHPRADVDREEARIREVQRRVSRKINVIRSPLNIEQVLIANEEIPLTVISVASSAVYTLAAIKLRNHELICVDSPLLRRHFSQATRLYRFFAKIGVKVL